MLGYINAHAVLFDVGAFVSPQTGNLINMAIRLAQGDMQGLIITLLIFGGFFLGAFLATYVLAKSKNIKMGFYIQWSVFFIPILINFLFLDSIALRLMIFNYSFVSGAALCFFRKIGDIEVNNSIVTGNMRFMGNALFEVTFFKNRKKRAIFWAFTLATFLFFLGSLVMALLSDLGRNNALLVLVAIGTLPYLIGLKLR